MFNHLKISKMETLKFNSISAAKKQTKLSYLGCTNISAKIIKNEIVNRVKTYIIYLAPAKSSGFNVCPYATKECIAGCLATSGRARLEGLCGGCTIKNSRIKKTQLFHRNLEFFMQWLIADISAQKKAANRQKLGFSVRLNGTSDIDWANTIYNGKNIFQYFPKIQFYDYTKNPHKFDNLPSNYHLTFSHTGRNTEACLRLLERGFNVAVVFNKKKTEKLPENYLNYPVIDGDLTDYRPADPQGVIVGLRFKKIANKQADEMIRKSVFVVNC